MQTMTHNPAQFVNTYSPQNVSAILTQRPDATAIASYRQWLDLGRQVRKGERGIRILAPVLTSDTPSDNGAVKPRRYREVSVFDISQTDPISDAQEEKEYPTMTAAELTQPVPVPTIDAPLCPACHSPADPSDVFCGECGTRLVAPANESANHPTARVYARALADTLKHALSIMPPRGIPAAQYVRLTATAASLEVYVNTIDTAYQHTIAAEIGAPFTIAIDRNAAKMLAQVKSRDILTIAPADDTVTITTEYGSTTYPVRPADQMAVLPSNQYAPLITMHAGQLAEAIQYTATGAATDETRPVLTGILFDCRESLRLVSADGFRMHIRDTAERPERSTNVLVPARDTAKIARTFARQKTPVTITANDHMARFETDNGAFYVRTIDGTFPDWRQIVRKTDDTRVTMRTDALGAALAQIKPVTINKNGAVQFDASGNGECIVHQSDGDQHARATVPVTTQNDVADLFALNIDYLAALLKSWPESTITFGIHTPSTAICFRSPSHQAVIMPMIIG